MAFPVEGWRSSAGVVVRQSGDTVVGDVIGEDAEHAWQTALAALSLDVDGAAFPSIGERDPAIGKLQKHFNFARPVCFHSPYEAAAALIIGHRLSIAQTRGIRARLSAEHGEFIEVEGQRFAAFPRPQVLLELEQFGPIAGEKMQRLHGIAEAALSGRLDRERLRSLPVDDALAELRTLRGVGAFIAQGVLIRGASLPDAVSDDEVTAQAVQLAYALPDVPDRATILRMAEAWRPYRTWAAVLLHLWLRREGGPNFRRPGRR
jgi:DNA-3-methyladenine glycosylase II